MSKETFENIIKGDKLSVEHQFVSAEQLLQILFPLESRPTLRWLRTQQANRTIPSIKLGRLVFFNPAQVREALAKHQTFGR